MFNPIAKVLLTATSVAPVAFAYGWIFLVNEKYAHAFFCLSACITLPILCAVFVLKVREDFEKQELTINTVEAADRENIAFLLLYLFPLLSTEITVPDWRVVVPILGIFSWVVATGHNYHFNPLLGLAGWHFYKVSTPEGVTYILITKKTIKTTQHKFVISQITEYLLLDTEGD